MPKKKKEKQPKTLWANQISFCGLYSDDPVKVIWQDDLYSDVDGEETSAWWAEDGELAINKVGLDADDDGIVTFSSTSKEDVALWTQGAKTALAAMAAFCVAREPSVVDEEVRKPKGKKKK